jgi:SOS-response transcriptional repressor LexA
MENKSYYAVIPANVRYDPNLRDKAKLLYGEITALSNERGYCWATNEYFAKLYNVDKTTISKLIKNLIDNGYIKSHIIYKEGTKEIDKRYLLLRQEGIDKNDNTPIGENAKENITSINITSINNMNEREIKEINELFDSFLEV